MDEGEEGSEEGERFQEDFKEETIKEDADSAGLSRLEDVGVEDLLKSSKENNANILTDDLETYKVLIFYKFYKCSYLEVV